MFEIEDTRPSMANALYGFYGPPPVMSLQDAQDRIRASGLEEECLNDALDLLIWFGFLGVEMAADQAVQFSYQVRYNIRRLLHAVRTGQGRLGIHPAFHVALSVEA